MMSRNALFVALVLSASAANATTMVPLDLAALTDRAEAVVAGHVTQSQSAWTSAHDAIYTDSTLHVERVLAGGAVVGEDMVVRREGGTVDGVGMMVSGAPQLSPGQEVVLFVEHRGSARYVVGMAQGKLDVTTLPSGEKRLQRNLAELHFTRAPTPTEQALASIQTVDQLEVAVRRLAKSHK